MSSLSGEGDVYGWGSNAFGQLGCGDAAVREQPVRTRMPFSRRPNSHLPIESQTLTI